MVVCIDEMVASNEPNNLLFFLDEKIKTWNKTLQSLKLASILKSWKKNLRHEREIENQDNYKVVEKITS